MKLSIFQRFKVKLKCELFTAPEKSWRLHLRGSNVGPIETEIYKVHALPLSNLARLLNTVVNQEKYVYSKTYLTQFNHFNLQLFFIALEKKYIILL